MCSVLYVLTLHYITLHCAMAGSITWPICAKLGEPWAQRGPQTWAFVGLHRNMTQGWAHSLDVDNYGLCWKSSMSKRKYIVTRFPGALFTWNKSCMGDMSFSAKEALGVLMDPWTGPLCVLFCLHVVHSYGHCIFCLFICLWSNNVRMPLKVLFCTLWWRCVHVCSF